MAQAVGAFFVVLASFAGLGGTIAIVLASEGRIERGQRIERSALAIMLVLVCALSTFGAVALL